LIDKLFVRHGVALVGFDVVWAEHDASSGIDALDRLARELPQLRSAYARLRPVLDFDARFAAAMNGRAVVLRYYFNSEARAVRANVIPKPVLPAGSFSGRRAEFHQWQGYTGNLPAYLESAAAAGHINQLADADGVLRRMPLIAEFGGEYYESFSLAVFRTLLAKSLGAPPALEPGFKDDALETLKVGPFEIPVDENAATLIPYRGHKASFEYVPAADVLKDRVAPGTLKDKIVLVGATAPIVGFNVTVWQHGGLVLPLASSLLMVLALYTMNMAYGYFVESRAKRQFTELFGQYVPPELVRQMARDPRRYNMAPKSAEL